MYSATKRYWPLHRNWNTSIIFNPRNSVTSRISTTEYAGYEFERTTLTPHHSNSKPSPKVDRIKPRNHSTVYISRTQSFQRVPETSNSGEGPSLTLRSYTISIYIWYVFLLFLLLTYICSRGALYAAGAPRTMSLWTCPFSLASSSCQISNLWSRRSG